MKKLIGLIILLTVLTGCTTMGNLPSVCDKITEPSRLCELSIKHNVRLEDVGNGFIIFNAISIGQGLYTKEQALSVMKELRAVLDNPISYLGFRLIVEDKIDAYPGLLEVATIYFEQLGVLPQIMYPMDQKLLSGWLDKQIKILGG